MIPNPIPSVRHIALNELNRPKIDLSQPPMSYDELRGVGAKGDKGGVITNC